MPIIICPYCGKKVSNSNPSCIFCKKAFISPSPVTSPAKKKPQNTYSNPPRPVKHSTSEIDTTLLSSSTRGPLPSSLKGPMILCLILGLFFLFAAAVGFFSEITGGAGLGKVGGGSTIIGSSQGGMFIFSSAGTPLALISIIASVICLSVSFTIIGINSQHKTDRISVFEDRIEFSSKRIVETVKFSDLESCTLVKGVTIKIKIKGIDTPRAVFCVTNAERIVKLIYDQQQLIEKR